MIRVLLLMATPILLPALFLLGMWIFGPHWRTVQVLQSADRQHVAKLDRLYGDIDTNFRITLDGEKIHHSYDCAPRETIPCRETLAWDTTGKVLVFELANEIVFAYDLPSQAEIHPSRFDEITVPTITLDDIGFDGEDDLRRRQQETETETAQ